MEEYELWLLTVFAAAVLAKLLQQAALLCAPVRVPPLVPPPGADAVQTARDAAEWALYAKQGQPPGCKRLGLTISLLAAVAACVPVWWRLTEVYRAPLPLDALADAERGAPQPPALRLLVLRVLAAPAADATGEAAALAQRTAAALAAERSLLTHFAVSAAVAAPGGACAEADASTGSTAAAPPAPQWRCGELAAAARSWAALADADIDEQLQALGGAAAVAGAYTLVLLPGDACAVTYGAHRHAWARCGAAEGGALAAAAAALRWQAAPARGAEAAPPLSASGTLRLEFALCNAAPQAGHRFSWDFGAAQAHLVAPVAAALAPFASLRVGSSVLLHTAAGGDAAPRWDATRGAHVLPASALPQLVDPEWALHAPGGAPHERVLQLVAYVPLRRHCPLRLAHDAPGFTSPGWGGVAVWNPPECGRNATATDAAATSSRELSDVELRQLMALFVAQLRTLLGLPATLGADAVPAAVSGFADWEVDALARRAAAAHTAAAGESLAALGRVVRALPNMVISDTIAQLAGSALDALGAARRAAAAGLHHDAVASAAAAHAAAEGAFFHPSILSLLYFPSDHKLAVYLPLFLPALLPLVLAAMREGRHYRRRAAFAAAYRAHHQKTQ